MEFTLEQALQKGIEAHKAGNIQEADKYYTAILKANPKHPDANHNMGVLAVGIGKVEEALPFFQSALEVNQNIGQYWLSYINTLIRLDRLNEAKEVFNKAKNNGSEVDGLDQIEQKLCSSNSKNSNTQEPPQEELQSLINLYTQLQYQTTVNEAKKLLKKFPSSTDLYNIIGSANKSLGKLEQAIEAFSKALSINPQYTEAYYNMGNTLQDQGKLEEAIDAYKKAISIKPHYAQAHNNMGNALKSQGKLVDAIETYNKALSLKPDYADAYYNMGSALNSQGKLDEAIEAYSKACSLKPDYAVAYGNMGVTLQEQGKLDEAIEAYNKALSIKPDYAVAYGNMGFALQEQGKLDEAIEAYNKALSIKPDYADVYNNMGNALQKQGKLEGAIEAYSKALSIKPDNDEAIKNASSLRTQISDTELVNEEFEKSLERHSSELIAIPKLQIQQAIRAFLFSDHKLVRKHLRNYSNCPPSSIAKLKAKDQVFCSAYDSFLQKLIETSYESEPTIVNHQSVFHIGESHCLSYAHRKIKIHGIDFNVRPRITFGGKAYHFSTEKDNLYKAITKSNFESLPDGSKAFLSFGEIDCRPNEGFISAAKKYKKPIELLISNTARGYVDWFAEQNQFKNHSLFFFNVPAPIYNENYTAEVNEDVTRTIKLFNSLLHKIVLKHDFNLIDVYKFTVGNDGFSNSSFHIDSHHLSSDAITEIEKQLGTFL